MGLYRFGKHAPVVDYRTLKLKNYLSSSLPAPPVDFNTLPIIYKNLSIDDPTTLFPIDGNDTLGDCTIAGIAHLITVYNGMVGRKVIMSADCVKKLYFHLSGGEDTGLNELDCLNYWQTYGVAGEKILGYVSVDSHNHDHVKQAIQMFGGVYLGFQVQESCMGDFERGVPWTPGYLTNNGHAVPAVAYDPSMLMMLTWGRTQRATWDWWDETVDECYAILPPEAMMPMFAPGIDLEHLKYDLAMVAN